MDGMMWPGRNSLDAISWEKYFRSSTRSGNAPHPPETRSAFRSYPGSPLKGNRKNYANALQMHRRRAAVTGRANVAQNATVTETEWREAQRDVALRLWNKRRGSRLGCRPPRIRPARLLRAAAAAPLVHSCVASVASAPAP